MASPKIRALFDTTFNSGPPNAFKYVDLGGINVRRKESSSEYTVSIQNIGDSDLQVTGMDFIKGINSFMSDGYNAGLDQTKSYGFVIRQLVQFPFTVPHGELQTGFNEKSFYNAYPVLKISYDGNGVPDDLLHNIFNLQIIFNSNDPRNGDDFDDGRGSKNHSRLFSGVRPGNITFGRVIIEASPKGKLSWDSNSNLVFEKNIHGYISTPKVKDTNLWGNYAKKRISDILNGTSRITISDFLKMNDFQNNREFNDDIPEVKRVFNRFEDPIPPYDFMWPYGDYYPYNGLRRTIDYSPNRIDRYYKRARSYFKWNIDKSLVLTADSVRELGGDFIKIAPEQKRQRREWGFREKVIKGFPYFFPKNIKPSNTEKNPFSNNLISPCGTGPVIAGFVTAGSGIFGGIPSSANIGYDFIETQKTVNSPTDLPHTNPKIPTGLIFIQDETGAIGFSLGSDMRYMENPLFHNSNYAESSLIFDKMHLGSIGIPKADYRQFLREGDLVVIQLGVGLKYWHPVLGAEPRYWENLFGEEEFKKVQESRKSSVAIIETDNIKSSEKKRETTKKTIVTPEGEVLEVDVPVPTNKNTQSSNTTYETVIPPYVDNWGAYTDRPSNNAMELAINYDLFENETAPEIFDATLISRESAARYLEGIMNVVNGAVEGAKEGAVEGAKEGAKVGGPFGAVIGGIVGAIVGGVIVGVTQVVLMETMFYRERYVLRSRSLRDGQYPYTTFYPIQEYHPWSTGTPIPIDNGMPYIMSDVFSVDTRERLAPAPKQVTCAQLRGIPEDTWRWNPNLEWEIPKKHLESKSGRTELVEFRDPETGEVSILEKRIKYTDSFRNPYIPGPNNVTKEFHGIEDEPPTPYTLSPGSQYKGQLVTIKNVRFIKPPMKEYLVAKVASSEKLKQFKEDRTKILSELSEWINSGKDIKEFKIQFADLPEIQLQLPKILTDISDILKYGVPSLRLAITFMETFFKGELDKQFVSGTTTVLNELEKVNAYVSALQSKMENIISNGLSGFTSETQINEILSIKHGIDYQGFEISVDYGHELMTVAHKAIGDINIGNVLEKLGISFIVAILDALGLSFVGKTLNMVYSTLDTYRLPEVPEPNQYQVGSITREYSYEKVTAPSEFPASVDKKNGGYWWACPSIPLTNARSHQNDANFGDPNTDDDNEGDSINPNQDISSTERTVFSQLVSSNKVEISVPIWDPWNGSSWIWETNQENDQNEFGKKHTYNIAYIRSRYVRDLGREYSSSYEPFAEEWKPYRYVDGQTMIKNEFQPIDSGSKFVGNRTYYVVDENNVVIPIRINANTEIARYLYDVPTGSVDITGIAWQYSLGVPGLEWEREAYMMQIWPRYLSDVGIKYEIPPIIIEPETPTPPPVTGGPDVPPPPTPPVRLPDLTLDLGDAGNPARLDCESVRQLLNVKNKEREDFEKFMSWPVVRKQNELNPNSDNIHRDPITGREILLPSDPARLKQQLDSMPIYPCKGMKVGDQQYVTITSQQFPGVRRTFFFTVGPNGECLCTMIQPGNEIPRTNNRSDTNVFGQTNQDFTQNRSGIM